jgi:protein arginine kinase activator
MICDICRRNNAVIHIEKHAGENRTQMKICSQCAGVDSMSPEHLKGEDLQKIISDLVSNFKPKAQEVCEKCGTSAIDFEKKHKVGCGSCYKFLKSAIHLQNWQAARNLKHVGRTPFNVDVEQVSFDPNVEDVELLEEKLCISIIAEDYEEAALLRDKIETLKKALL